MAVEDVPICACNSACCCSSTSFYEWAGINGQYSSWYIPLVWPVQIVVAVAVATPPRVHPVSLNDSAPFVYVSNIT